MTGQRRIRTLLVVPFICSKIELGASRFRASWSLLGSLPLAVTLLWLRSVRCAEVPARLLARLIFDVVGYMFFLFLFLTVTFSNRVMRLFDVLFRSTAFCFTPHISRALSPQRVARDRAHTLLR